MALFVSIITRSNIHIFWSGCISKLPQLRSDHPHNQNSKNIIMYNRNKMDYILCHLAAEDLRFLCQIDFFSTFSSNCSRKPSVIWPFDQGVPLWNPSIHPSIQAHYHSCWSNSTAHLMLRSDLIEVLKTLRHLNSLPWGSSSFPTHWGQSTGFLKEPWLQIYRCWLSCQPLHTQLHTD